MSLKLPNLDDRTYEDLVAEALRMIPTYAPEWTNHNPSDPGITLIELFAYLTEMLLYRLNRITDANKAKFLKLLVGTNAWKDLQTQWRDEWRKLDATVPVSPEGDILRPPNPSTLNYAVQQAVLALRQSDRAVTCADFETLALTADTQVQRARCIPRRNLEASSSEDSQGHVSVVLLPYTPELAQIVSDYLKPRRLLTTQVHVVAPRYLPIAIQVTLVLKPDAREEDVRTNAITALQQFFDPYKGGPNGKGWPFGRDVYVSEVYELLDRISGVDYVQRTETRDEIKVSPVYAQRRRVVVQEQQEFLTAITLELDELIDARINPSDLQLISPSRAQSIQTI